jgi:hypothetical protein
MSEEVRSTIVILVILCAIAMLAVCVIKHEEIFEWVKNRLTKKHRKIDLSEWYGADVRIGMHFASNGVVIRAFSEVDMRHGGIEATLNTRVAHNASEIGNEVMALLSEIQLGK